MAITLDQILDLVGKLDDAPGDDTPRERFRRFLATNVKEAGQVRDYIEECLRTPGEQHSRALQDLANYVGKLLEFDVVYGRYQGVSGQIGYDGFWKSPSKLHLAVEVKTSETYPIKTAALVGYIDNLISEKRIPDWDHAMGLYVVGRPDPEVRQLENAIICEKRTHQLRVISVESLLSLAEMMSAYDVSHDDILAVLRPSGPKIDPLVSLMATLAAQGEPGDPPQPPVQPPSEQNSVAAYWMTPVSGDEEETGEEVVERLVEREKVYAWASRTPGRKFLKPGDCICFYAAGSGVVAHATVRTKPAERRHAKVKDPDKYSWVFNLGDALVHVKKPIVLDASLRAKLDAFKGRDPNKSWSWFVQATRKITQHDFGVLTQA